MSLFKHFISFSSFTLLSRILGLIRDILIAHKLGASALTDIFFTAFRLPNLFRSLFAEGALSNTFIPMYNCQTNTIEKQSFANNIFTILAVVLVIFCFIVQLYMPLVVYVFTPGFAKNPVYFTLAVEVSRIVFPYLLFIALSALVSGVLQSQNIFFATAFTPIILNLCLIATLWFNKYTTNIVYSLAWSALLAGILQLLWLLYITEKNQCRIRIVPRISFAQTKEFFRKLFPAALSSGINQINIWIDTFMASFIVHAVSYLYYAERIQQLPLALIGTSLSITTLPILTRQLHKKEITQAIAIQNKALELSLLFCIPAASGLYILSTTIVSAFLQSKAFDLLAVTKTAQILQVLAFALPGSIMYKVFITIFLADKDTTTPMKIALLSLALNLIFNLILIPFYKEVGIVLATTISTWICLVLLINILRKKNLYKMNTRLKSSLIKIIWANGFMILIITAIQLLLERIVTLQSIYYLVILTLTGIATYFSSLAIMRYDFLYKKFPGYNE